MELECGKVKKEIHMLDNGNKVRLKVLEYLLRSMVVDMRVNFIILLRMDRVLKNFQVEIYIRENILMVNLMDLVSTIGKMEVIIRGISKKEFVVVTVFGKRVISIVINIKDNF